MALKSTPDSNKSLSVNSNLAKPPPNNFGKSSPNLIFSLSSVSLNFVLDSKSIFLIALARFPTHYSVLTFEYQFQSFFLLLICILCRRKLIGPILSMEFSIFEISSTNDSSVIFSVI